MFSQETYIRRRRTLTTKVCAGILFFPANNEMSFNYPANTYSYRQDSTFLYYFGIDSPGYAGIMDVDAGVEILFGNEVTMDDIIWSGALPSLSETAHSTGIHVTKPFDQLAEYLKKAQSLGRKIHYLPPYRDDIKIFIHETLGIPFSELKKQASEDLIKGVVAMRSVKEIQEIEDIERTVDVAYLMHTAAMRMAHEGKIEQEIAGVVEGLAISHGRSVSFPVILSQNGQILHNHGHNNPLQNGRLMVTDAGAESAMRYCSDITRTVPVGGKFSQQQKEIYEIALKANVEVAKAVRPDVFYKDIHLMACEIIATGLTDLGLMKGNPKDAVAAGAHALFMPHGLGHMLGLDVHDMENLGENYVGYDNTVQRSSQFGLAFLRLARKLQPGFVLTDEPGIYFIPALIDLWKSEGKHNDFINYSKLEAYRDFGGIRIEDDLLVTEVGCKVLGKPIPKTVTEIETEMQKAI